MVIIDDKVKAAVRAEVMAVKEELRVELLKEIKADLKADWAADPKAADMTRIINMLEKIIGIINPAVEDEPDMNDVRPVSYVVRQKASESNAFIGRGVTSSSIPKKN